MASLDDDAQIFPSIGIEGALVVLAAIELERHDSFDYQVDRLEVTDSHLTAQ